MNKKEKRAALKSALSAKVAENKFIVVDELKFEEIKTIYSNFGYDTEIIVASIRSPRQVTEAALIGADIATIPFKVLKQMVSHPQTDLGIAKFEADWANRK